MMQYVPKISVSAIVVVAVTELAKRSTFWGAALVALPLTSLLGFVWLYLDTGDTQKVGALFHDIFWLLLPSLVLFVTLPLLLRLGFGFWASLCAACAMTAMTYGGLVKILKMLSIPL